MRAWRLCQARHASDAFSGEGARRYGGRWNLPGTPVVYVSENQALAALEMLVHLPRNEMPPDLVYIAVDIPDELPKTTVDVVDLEPGWNDYPPPVSVQQLGSDWASSCDTVVLVVPSVQVPDECNLLLNPVHPDFHRLKIGRPEPFSYDERLLERTERIRRRRRRSV